eukprot:IDg11092t1
MFTIHTLPSNIATKIGGGCNLCTAGTISMLERKIVLLLNAMETQNGNVAEFTSSIVSAIKILRELDNNDTDSSFKKLQQLELVLRTQSGLPNATEQSLLQCLRDESGQNCGCIWQRSAGFRIERGQ